jgi:hypothetical protein
MSKIVAAFGFVELVQQLSEVLPEIGKSATGALEQPFQLGEALIDEIEVRAIWWLVFCADFSGSGNGSRSTRTTTSVAPA